MTENAPLPASDPIATLLDTARRARQNGDRAGARALLRAITTRHPGDVRGWLLLATVAETRTEQRHALEQVLAIDPANRAARRALDRIGTTTAYVIAQPVELAAPTVVSAQNEQTDDAVQQARTIRWPLYALLAIAAATIIVTALLVWRPQEQQAQATSAATPPAGGSIATTSAIDTVVSTVGQASVPTSLSTVAPILTSPPEPTPQPTAPPFVESTSTPIVEPTALQQGPTATPAVSFGQFQQQDQWNISLLRPTDAVVLSGSIGQLQPQGRFVLALVAIGNQSTSERQLPVDLLTLVDAQGNRYVPQPAASTAYLQAYGEGQAGVVSMESEIAPGDVVVSVPVIFDVPDNASGLQLTVNQAREGWSVGTL